MLMMMIMMMMIVNVAMSIMMIMMMLFVSDAKGNVLSGITNGGSKTRYFYKKADDVVESMKKALAKTSLDQGTCHHGRRKI